jgi:hypothetical protein
MIYTSHLHFGTQIKEEVEKEEEEVGVAFWKQ